MDYKYQRIKLDRIDTTDAFYRITTTQDKSSIFDSLRRIGLISPVTLKETDRRPIIVSGFRRFETCRQLGWETLPCRVLPCDTSHAKCVELSIADNTTQRSLNIIEQARCLRLLSDPRIGTRLSVEMADSLGISLNKAYVSKLNKILLATETIQKGIISGEISMPVALLLSELSNDAADAVATLFSKMPMGSNKQREVLLYLMEISARDDIPLRHLVSEGAIQDTLNNDELEGNQKSRIVRSYLKNRRYPRLVSIEKQFQERVSALKLGSAIQILPPANFEGSSCTMTIRFDSLKALENANRQISGAIDNSIASELFG